MKIKNLLFWLAVIATLGGVGWFFWKGWSSLLLIYSGITALLIIAAVVSRRWIKKGENPILDTETEPDTPSATHTNENGNVNGSTSGNGHFWKNTKVNLKKLLTFFSKNLLIFGIIVGGIVVYGLWLGLRAAHSSNFLGFGTLVDWNFNNYAENFRLVLFCLFALLALWKLIKIKRPDKIGVNQYKSRRFWLGLSLIFLVLLGLSGVVIRHYSKENKTTVVDLSSKQRKAIEEGSRKAMEEMDNLYKVQISVLHDSLNAKDQRLNSMEKGFEETANAMRASFEEEKRLAVKAEHDEMQRQIDHLTNVSGDLGKQAIEIDKLNRENKELKEKNEKLNAKTTQGGPYILWLRILAVLLIALAIATYFLGNKKYLKNNKLVPVAMFLLACAIGLILATLPFFSDYEKKRDSVPVNVPKKTPEVKTPEIKTPEIRIVVDQARATRDSIVIDSLNRKILEKFPGDTTNSQNDSMDYKRNLLSQDSIITFLKKRLSACEKQKAKQKVICVPKEEEYVYEVDKYGRKWKRKKDDDGKN